MAISSSVLRALSKIVSLSWNFFGDAITALGYRSLLHRSMSRRLFANYCLSTKPNFMVTISLLFADQIGKMVEKGFKINFQNCGQHSLINVLHWHRFRFLELFSSSTLHQLSHRCFSSLPSLADWNSVWLIEKYRKFQSKTETFGQCWRSFRIFERTINLNELGIQILLVGLLFVLPNDTNQ